MKQKNYPKPQEKFQHYKGGQYEVICMCNHTETKEPLVIYKSLSFGSQYARPFSQWYEEVDIETYGGKEYPISRFIKIEEF
jgi:hypothetical protein